MLKSDQRPFFSPTVYGYVCDMLDNDLKLFLKYIENMLSVRPIWGP